MPALTERLVNSQIIFWWAQSHATCNYNWNRLDKCKPQQPNNLLKPGAKEKHQLNPGGPHEKLLGSVASHPLFGNFRHFLAIHHAQYLLQYICTAV